MALTGMGGGVGIRYGNLAAARERGLSHLLFPPRRRGFTFENLKAIKYLQSVRRSSDELINAVKLETIVPSTFERCTKASRSEKNSPGFPMDEGIIPPLAESSSKFHGATNSEAVGTATTTVSAIRVPFRRVGGKKARVSRFPAAGLSPGYNEEITPRAIETATAPIGTRNCKLLLLAAARLGERQRARPYGNNRDFYTK